MSLGVTALCSFGYRFDSLFCWATAGSQPAALITSSFFRLILAEPARGGRGRPPRERNHTGTECRWRSALEAAVDAGSLRFPNCLATAAVFSEAPRGKPCPRRGRATSPILPWASPAPASPPTHRTAPHRTAPHPRRSHPGLPRWLREPGSPCCILAPRGCPRAPEEVSAHAGFAETEVGQHHRAAARSTPWTRTSSATATATATSTALPCSTVPKTLTLLTPTLPNPNH